MTVTSKLDAVGVKITNAVGTMWCAIAFFLLTLVSLPATLLSGNVILIVGWLTQTCAQLVLLPIIMVGQRDQAEKTDNLVSSHEHTHRMLDALHRHHGIETGTET